MKISKYYLSNEDVAAVQVMLPLFLVVIFLFLFGETNVLHKAAFCTIVKYFGYATIIFMGFRLYSYARYRSVRNAGIAFIVILWCLVNVCCFASVIAYYGYYNYQGVFSTAIGDSLYISFSNFINRSTEYRTSPSLQVPLLIQGLYGYIFTIYIIVALLDIVKNRKE